MTSPFVGSSGSGFRPTALAVSASGMQAAAGRLDADARSIAVDGPDVESMVDLDVQTHVYGALARVIRTSDEMTRSLLDVLA
jgi:flagellar basal body rod protein FlgC